MKKIFMVGMFMNIFLIVEPLQCRFIEWKNITNKYEIIDFNFSVIIIK